MTLQKDLREFVELFLSRNIDFLVVGAFAVAHHGYPRTTGDIDLFVRVNPENAEKIADAVREFGFGALGLQPADFLQQDMTIQMGFEPVRIDILTGISGVTFAEAWRDRTSGQLDGLPVMFLSREHLLRNKRASGRPKDKLDISELTGGDQSE
jgi:hypothetical protein